MPSKPSRIFKGRRSNRKTIVTLEIHTNKWRIGMNKEMLRRLRIVGAMMKRYFFFKLTGERSGNEYWISDLQKWYTASAPDEYPAEKYGLLRRSIMFRTEVLKTGPIITVGVGDSDVIEYAQLLEDPNSGIYRPFIKRGMLENEAAIKSVIRRPYRI